MEKEKNMRLVNINVMGRMEGEKIKMRKVNENLRRGG